MLDSSNVLFFASRPITMSTLPISSFLHYAERNCEERTNDMCARAESFC